MEQIMGLISKASVIIAFVFISTLLSEKIVEEKKKSQRFHQIAQGLIFCIFIFIDMNTPITNLSRISYDAREVLLNLAAGVYGPIAASITIAFTFLLRWVRGTKGTEFALIGIVLVYLWEMAVLYYCRRKKVKVTTNHIIIMSILTNLISAISVVIMGGEEWELTVIPALTFLFAYPVFTYVAYKIMGYIKNRAQLLKELSERDQILNEKNRKLQYANEEMRRTELLFRTLFYHSSEAIFLMHKDEIADVNIAAMELLGFKDKQDIVGKSLYLFMPDSQADDKKTKDYMEDILHRVENKKPIQTEISLLTKNEVELYLEGVFIEIEMMDKKYVYMSARDIRERKKQEKEILYHAQHDPLTEVANRQYYNEMLKQITADENNYPIAFMMADINGLKLTNDIFGHSKGDELIKKIAKCLTKSCRNHDLVARVGGDEFIIIFPNANERAVQAVMERIKSNLGKERVETLCPSISMGYAVKDGPEEDSDHVISRADDMMYKNKALNRQENAEVFLDNILDYLYEKYPEDKKSVVTLLEMLEKLDRNACYQSSYKKEVKKLILYYNLGKLVSNEEDWKMEGTTMLSLKFSQKLIETSYAILKNIGEIKSAMIAECLVSINEHWDGSGFALASTGEEIPYPVRVFKLLFDIYYIKNNAEIFGNPSEEELKRKLQTLAGRRYDPELAEKFFEILL